MAVRSTRKVNQNFSDLEMDFLDLSSAKGSFKAKKKMLLNIFERKADGRRHQLESTLNTYYSTIRFMYSGLITKIPKQIQDMPINDYLAISENAKTSPTNEDVPLFNARPSEVAAIAALPKRRERKSRKCKRTPRSKDVEVVDLENESPTSEEKPMDTVMKKKGGRSAMSTKEKKSAKHSTADSTYKPPKEEPASDVPARKLLRSNSRSTSSNEGAVRSVRKMPERSTTRKTPSVAGSARLSKNAASAAKTSAPAKKSLTKSTSSGRGRPTKGRMTSAKTPLTQQNRSEPRTGSKTPSFGAYTLVTPGYKLRERTRPGEKVMVLSKDACPLVESQPTIICPLEDGSALAISSDTDFKSLTISEGVLENLRNFQQKLCSFLNLTAYAQK